MGLRRTGPCACPTGLKVEPLAVLTPTWGLKLKWSEKVPLLRASAQPAAEAPAPSQLWPPPCSFPCSRIPGPLTPRKVRASGGMACGGAALRRVGFSALARQPLPGVACGLWLSSRGTAVLGPRSPCQRSRLRRALAASSSHAFRAGAAPRRHPSPPPPPTPHLLPAQPAALPLRAVRLSLLSSPPPGEGREGAWQGHGLCSCCPAPRTRSLQKERGPRRCPAALSLSRPAPPPPPPLLLSPLPLRETQSLADHGLS